MTSFENLGNRLAEAFVELIEEGRAQLSTYNTAFSGYRMSRTKAATSGTEAAVRRAVGVGLRKLEIDPEKI